jgi:hypothetical protein
MVNEPPPLPAGIGVAQKPELEVGLKTRPLPDRKARSKQKIRNRTIQVDATNVAVVDSAEV